MPERDPHSDPDGLEALRSAWSKLEAPEAMPERGDAQTEAALDWMRAAWSALEAPEPVVPVHLPRRRFRLRLVRGAALVLAAAAVLLLCTLFLRGQRDVAPPQEPEQLATAPEITPAPAPAAAAPTAPVRRVVVDAPEDGLVLEHGSVRLVLLDTIEETLITEPDPITEPASGFGQTQEN